MLASTIHSRKPDAPSPDEGAPALFAHEMRIERLRCAADASYFCHHYLQIESPEQRALLPFALWPAQEEALRTIQSERKVVVLKARQLGLTWLALSHALWLMLFRPPATILLFSLRESEARELLRRLRALHARLPTWLQQPSGDRAAQELWTLGNGSRALAFSTRAGRSYTGTLALVDEADFVPHLADFLNAVKPTVDGGGQLLLLSTADKAQPQSPFKRLFRAGWEGVGDYAALFLPWHARPDRSPAWYAAVRAEMFAQRGSDDDLHQEYPATVEEALRVRLLAARIPADDVAAVSAEAVALPWAVRQLAAQMKLSIPTGAALFCAPEPDRPYVAGADPAEGNPASDESVMTVLDALSGEQVALLAGKLPPELFAHQCAQLCALYNGAPLLVERNNHGHTVLAWLREGGIGAPDALRPPPLLRGLDGKPGWLTTAVSKTRLYDELARACRARALLLHDAESAAQLAAIEAATLRAPAGLHDDRATALALAFAALTWGGAAASPVAPIEAEDPLRAYDRSAF